MDVNVFVPLTSFLKVHVKFNINWSSNHWSKFGSNFP